MNGTDLLQVATAAAAFAATGLASTVYYRWVNKRLGTERDEESDRLRSVILGEEEARTFHVAGDLNISNVPDTDPQGDSLRAGEQRVDDDRFAELLIEYYAWGLTQARRSTALSLTCSGIGVCVLLIGVALAIWKAETTGDLYVSIVASMAGLVSTIIGQLAHRRADSAMVHMQRQTNDLRQDMKRERETETAIRLAGEVEDPELKAELQAALVLKLSGSTLVDVRDSSPTVKIPSPSVG
ncbi:hypothetical protein ACIRQF_07150 [Streptomyces sp. NPDC101191]|uniref:TRADD-N-associated membrane domain-containing protein n=1 Tax=Streptomyces sp. NPDC101191 TaxID=3366126 RepID=UPI00380168CF